ncbi:serine/threonine-protein phosphatase [Candidatus Gracilibacteria bacterium]|nr:serine/threonine-protein phosphatase [Candidatus Gracilibacteria bacterium]
MKGFFSIFQATVLIILIINPLVLFLLGKDFLNLEGETKIYTITVLIAIEFIVILTLVKKFFHDPIIKLEHTIKNFLVGNLKDTNLKFKKTLNPHLNYSLSFFAKTLNTLKNIKDEFIHGKEIKSEVELGKEIQGKMLTKKLVQVPDLDVIIKSKPAGEIGGDSFDIIHEGDNYYIYVADATGHGVGAGFIMIMVNALISGFAKVYQNGASIVANANTILKPRIKANLLMSLLMVRWNTKEKRLFMTGAGHEYLMIYKYKQNKTFRIKSGGIALGMVKNASKLLKEQEIKFEENDIIVMYSDGITEAINKPVKDGTEQMFLEDRLEECIQNSPNVNGKDYKSARSVFNNITIELSKFMGYNPVQLDDITLATIHYKPKDFNANDDFPEEIKKDFITEWNW